MSRFRFSISRKFERLPASLLFYYFGRLNSVRQDCNSNYKDTRNTKGFGFGLFTIAYYFHDKFKQGLNMQDNYNIVRKILKLSFIDHDIETVKAVINKISHEKKITIDDDQRILPIDIYSFIFNRLPSWIIHYEAYLHDYVNPIVTYLVVEKMRYKLNIAKKREIQEVCFYAQNIYDDERAESFSHAVNSAVKVYIEKEWVTPFGFVEAFKEYLHEID